MTKEVDTNNFFFWLDPEEDTIETLTELEFRKRIEEFKTSQKNWENVIGN